MKITKALLRKIFPYGRDDLLQVIVDHWDAADVISINTPRRAAYLFANIGVETGGLRALEENLNYTAGRLRAVWPRRFPTMAAAQKVAGKPQAIANLVYGSRLGNKGGTDGWVYRGSGMLQTTGRANFRASGYEDNPDQLRKPLGAWLAALDYWRDHNINALADKDRPEAVRKAINGGLNGLDDMKAYLARAKAALAGTDSFGLVTALEEPDAAPEPPQDEPEAFVDEDGDGEPDVVKDSSTLTELQGKLSQANDLVSKAEMAQDSSIVRIGRRVVKGASGLVLAAPAAIGGSAVVSEQPRGFWMTVYDYIDLVPGPVYLAALLVLGGAFAFYAHWNVDKRVLLQKQGRVLPKAVE